MQKMIKSAVFSGVINLIFAFSLVTTSLYAMEEQPASKTIRQALPLTHIAADAFIKSIQKDGALDETTIDHIKQKLDEQEDLIQGNEAVLGLIEQHLGRNAYVIEHEFDTKQPLDTERIVGTIPELRQIITHTIFEDEYSIWSKSNLEKIGTVAGIATTPCLAQHLTVKKSFLHNKWNRLQTIKQEDFQKLDLGDFRYSLIFSDKNILIFLIKDQLMPYGHTLVLYRYKDERWQQDSKIEMKQPILYCAYSSQDNILACALQNKTVVMLKNDPDLNLWFEDSVITLENEKEIYDLSFLSQPYEIKPILIIATYVIVDSLAHSSCSFWRFIENEWHCVETYIPPDDKTVVLSIDDTRTYNKEEFNGLSRCSSPDSSKRLFIKNGEIKIHDAVTEALIKVIKPLDTSNLYSVRTFFIDNDTIALVLDYYDEDKELFSESNVIVSLKGSTDFSLCTQVLAKAQENPKINVKTLLSSEAFQSLGTQEKQRVLTEIGKIKENRSLKTKLQQLRKSCKFWAQNNRRKAYLIKGTASLLIPGSIFMGTLALHYNYGPKFMDWDLPFLHRLRRASGDVIFHATLPLFAAYALQEVFDYYLGM